MDTRHTQSAAIQPSDKRLAPGKGNRSWSVSGIMEVLQWAIKGGLSLTILALFLYIGQYLVQFSGLDSQAEVTNPLGTAVPKASGPMTIRFADTPFAFYRETFMGSDDELRHRVQEACHRMAIASQLPVTVVGAEEANLLATLSTSEVIASSEGILVCQTNPTIPLFVGLRYPNTNLSGPVTSEMVRTARVVSWGSAVPIESGAWNIRVVGRRGEERDGRPLVSLPPKSLKILHLEGHGSSSVLAFTSQSSLDVQTMHFDQQFANQDWEKVVPWTISNDQGRGIYTRRVADCVESAHVHICRDDSTNSTDIATRWHGIINLAQQPQTD